MQGTVRGQPMKLKTGTSYLGALCGPENYMYNIRSTQQPRTKEKLEVPEI